MTSAAVSATSRRSQAIGSHLCSNAKYHVARIFASFHGKPHGFALFRLVFAPILAYESHQSRHCVRRHCEKYFVKGKYSHFWSCRIRTVSFKQVYSLLRQHDFRF